MALSPEAAAQEQTAQAPLQRYQAFTHVTGLPSLDVQAVFEDRNRFAWFGTFTGLAYWNGDQTVSVDIGTKSVTAIEETDDWLWVGTDTGLMALDRMRRLVKQPLLQEGVLWIRPQDAKTVWVGTPRGVFRAGQDGQVIEEKELSSLAPVTAWLQEKDGRVRLGTESGTLALYDPRTRTIVGKRVTVPSAVTALESALGKIWIGTSEDGLFTATTGEWSDPQLGPSLGSPGIRGAAWDGESLWVGTQRGLYRIGVEGEPEGFLPRTWDESSVPHANVNAVFASPGRNVIVGSPLGAVMLSPRKELIPRYVTASPFSEGMFSSTTLTQHEGETWGAQTGALFRVNWKRRTITFYDWLTDENGERLETDYTTGLTSFGGRLWMGSEEHGLLGVDPKTMSARRLGGDLHIGRAMRIVPRDRTKLWLATWGTGLVLYDSAADTIDAPLAQGNEFLFLYDLLIDPGDPNSVWLAGARSGLARYDAVNRRLDKIKLDEQSAEPTVTRLAVAANGHLWVATYGLGVLEVSPSDHKVLRRLTARDGLDSDKVEDVLVDGDGNVWIVSSKGLRVLLPDGKLRTLLDAENFSDTGDENIQGAAVLLGDEILVGGTNGFFRFKRKDVLGHEVPQPRVVLTGFTVKGKEYPLEKPIWERPPVELGYNDAFFSVAFAALPELRSASRRYRFRLHGLHDEWIEGGSPATYSGLAGGQYSFAVQVLDDSGNWSEPVALLINVLPPWWRTWWAYSIYAVLVLLAGGSVYRYQAAKIRRLEKMRRLDALETQIGLTAAVQEGFLPKQDTAEAMGLRLAGYYHPAEECGGDWWWYEMNPDGSALILVGDVTGHGVASAMLTAAVASVFRTRADASVEDRLHAIHNEILRVTGGKLMVTATAVWIDRARSHYRVYGAGGLPLFRVRDGMNRARAELVQGAPLGSSSFSLGTREGTLSPGDRLLVFTDGIVEALTTAGRPLGMMWLAKQLAGSVAAQPKSAVEAVVQAARTAMGDRPLEDDWTLVIVDRRTD